MSRTYPLRAELFDTGILGDGDGVHHGGSQGEATGRDLTKACRPRQMQRAS